MKKFFSFLAIASAILAFNSCEQQGVEEFKSVDHLTFTSAKPEIQDAADTKTGWTGSSVQWLAGDKIRVGFTLDGAWQSSGKDDDTTPRFYASSALDADTDIASFSVPFGDNTFQESVKELEGGIVFYGVYPSSACSAAQKDAPNLSVTIPYDQQPSASSFDASADFMVGQSKPVEAMTEDPILMSWNRVVALADITLKGLNVLEGEKLLYLTLTAQESANLAGSQIVNVTDGTYTANKSTNEIKLDLSSLEINSNNLEVWAVLLPETVSYLKVVLETDSATYTKEISGLSLSFKKNKRNILGIKMENAERIEKAPTEQVIEGGNYVIAATYNNNDYMMTAATSGNIQGVSNLSTTTDSEGRLIADEDAVWTISYDSDNGVYYVYSASSNKFLNGTAGSTNLKLVDESDKTGFSGVKNSDETFSLTVSSSSTTRGIGYNHNNGSPRFGMYSITSKEQITKLNLIPAVAEEKPVTIDFTTIAELNALAKATATMWDGTLENAIVSFAPDANNAIIKDATGSILVYKQNHGLKQGQTFTGDFTPTIKLFNGTAEITDLDTATFTGEEKVVEPESLTLADLVGNIAKYQNAYVKVDDLTVTSVSGQNINVENGANTYVVYSSAADATCVAGDVISVVGTIAQYKSTDQIKAWTTDAITVTSSAPGDDTEYTITVADAENGTVEASATAAKKGTEITLTINPAEGYTLDALTVKDAENNDITVNDNKFTMPASNVTVSATFKAKEVPSGSVTDVLNQATTGVTGTSYTEWSGKTSKSDAVYAGQSAGGNNSIQLRSNNSNSGVVTTASGGKVTKIVVKWNSNTTSGRTLNIYGSNTAYTSATDLYDSTKQGTLLGTIVYGTSTELTIDGDYSYVGFRSNSGAMYLTEVDITWE